MSEKIPKINKQFTLSSKQSYQTIQSLKLSPEITGKLYPVGNGDSLVMLPLLPRSAIQEYIGVRLALSQEFGRLGLSAVQNTLLSSTSNCLVTP